MSAPQAARERRIADARLFAMVIIWSASFPVVKAAIGEFGPLTCALFLSEPVGLLQLAGGVIIIAGVGLTRQRTMLPRPSKAAART